MIKRWLAALALLGMGVGMAPGASGTAAAGKLTIKLATLAPEGSTWWNVFMTADKRLRELSGDELRIKLYAGGVAGDEPDVVRKMRVGQLHGAALTSVGLAELQPEVLALQAPGLFGSWDELEAVRGRIGDKLSALLAEKGYTVLTWGDVGFNRVFSNVPVARPADLIGTKAWCWTQDGVYLAWYGSAGVKPVPLGVPEVLPSLQTGLIDAFSTPPLAVVSLQWFNRTKYMLDYPVSVTIGAVVLTKATMNKLTDEQRKVVMQVGAEVGATLAAIVREDERKSIDAIRNAGITVTKPDGASVQAWQSLALKAQDAAAGKVYSPAILEAVRQTVNDVRAAK